MPMGLIETTSSYGPLLSPGLEFSLIPSTVDLRVAEWNPCKHPTRSSYWITLALHVLRMMDNTVTTETRKKGMKILIKTNNVNSFLPPPHIGDPTRWILDPPSFPLIFISGSSWCCSRLVPPMGYTRGESVAQAPMHILSEGINLGELTC